MKFPAQDWVQYCSASWPGVVSLLLGFWNASSSSVFRGGYRGRAKGAVAPPPQPQMFNIKLNFSPSSSLTKKLTMKMHPKRRKLALCQPFSAVLWAWSRKVGVAKNSRALRERLLILASSLRNVCICPWCYNTEVLTKARVCAKSQAGGGFWLPAPAWHLWSGWGEFESETSALGTSEAKLVDDHVNARRTITMNLSPDMVADEIQIMMKKVFEPLVRV